MPVYPPTPLEEAVYYQTASGETFANEGEQVLLVCIDYSGELKSMTFQVCEATKTALIREEGGRWRTPCGLRSARMGWRLCAQPHDLGMRAAHGGGRQPQHEPLGSGP